MSTTRAPSWSARPRRSMSSSSIPFSGMRCRDHLCSTEFFHLARSRLTPGGMLLFNAVVAHDLDRIVDRLAAGMAEAGFATRILDTSGERDRNAIVLGGPVARLRRPTLLVLPDTRSDALAAELDAMAFPRSPAGRPDPRRD